VRATLREIRQKNLDDLRAIRTDAERVKNERLATARELRRQLRRFEVDAIGQKDAVSLTAQAELASRLETLIGIWFKDKSASSLEQNADRWYGEQLAKAINVIEEKANAKLKEMVGESSATPEPLTIAECMAVKARVKLAEQAVSTSVGAKTAAIVICAALGALLGSVFHGHGTVIGPVARVRLVLELTRKKVKPVDYVKQSRATWASSTRDVLAILDEQFESRLAELKLRIERRLAQIHPTRFISASLEREARNATPLALELQRRRSLEAAIEACEKILMQPELT
jgi:hypothetical protein